MVGAWGLGLGAWGLGLGAWGLGLGLGKVSTVLTLKRPDEGLTLETLAFKL